MRCGADLDPKTLALGSGRHGLGVFARRRIRKGELVAAVPRATILQEPLAVAASQRGGWYDVLGSEQGAASARRLAERIVEAEACGSCK